MVGESVIAFHSLGFSYSTKSMALKDVCFSIPRGAIFALLGPNGAGKTTLLRLLTGKLHPQYGTITVPQEWQNKGQAKPTGMVLDKRRYSALIENPGVYNKLTVLEYLHFFGSFYLDEPERTQSLEQLLTQFALPAHQLVKQLSLGMKQKLQIARCLLHKPGLVLLDEPTANLDPESREQFWQVVQDLHVNHHTTFLICSHVLSEMEEHASHFAFIQNGTVKLTGSKEELLGTQVNQSIEICGQGALPSLDEVKQWLQQSGYGQARVQNKSVTSLMDMYKMVMQQ
jgi:ABC-2 type transport system ATP-binding protein